MFVKETTAAALACHLSVAESSGGANNEAPRSTSTLLRSKARSIIINLRRRGALRREIRRKAIFSKKQKIYPLFQKLNNMKKRLKEKIAIFIYRVQ